LITAIGLAGPVWLASMTYSVDGTRAALDTRLQTTIQASDLARQLDAVDPSDTATLNRIAHQASSRGATASISSRDGTVIAGERKLPLPLAEWLAQPRPPGTDSTSSPRDGQVIARSVASTGLVAVVVAPVSEWNSSSLTVTFIMFFLVVIAW